MTHPLELLNAWIGSRASPGGAAWLSDRRSRLQAAGTERDFWITFGMVPRKLGREDLALGPDELDSAARARAGWDPSDWSIDQAARLALMLEFGGEGDDFAQRLARMTAEAEVSEALALFRGLPLYPNPEKLVEIAAEGLRTNMLGVFEAIVHRSPFPKEVFDQQRWNQMVLKAVFMGSPLAPIQGLDARANEELAVILIDTARERRAAGRKNTFELWRCVGRHAREDMIEDMVHELRTGDDLGRRGAALALAEAPHGIGRAALETATDLAAAVDAGELNWESLSRATFPGLRHRP